jgi:membrane protein
MLHDFLKSLCIWICVPIYGLIPKIYSIFFNLANTRFLKSDLVEQFSANLYVLVSVIMLFGFSITILSAIVNPDLLSDSKKGVPAMFKRAIIGLALMVIIPFAFDEMYKIQENVMTNSLIEKIIVGADFSCDENDDSCEVGGNGGQVIAGTLIQSVLRPAEDTVETSQNIEEDYNNMIQKDITKINRIADSINITREDAGSTTEDGNHVFHFDGLIAIIVGAGVCYILILFALDMAVRIFKLAFLELTAPISIVGYIAAGDKIISSWFKEVGKTFLDVFIRIAAIAFYLFLINNLSSFMVDFEGKTWRYVLIAFLIIGMLIFAKQVPDMIGKIFGIDMKSQGGIAGRLGNMAGVGNVAKKAWEAVRNPIAAAAGIGSMALGTGAHIASAARTSFNNGKKAVQRIRADGKKHGIKTAGAVASAIGSGLWGASVGSVSAAARSLKNGVNNKNLHSMKDEYDLYKDTHKEGSTAVGRAIDDIRLGTGFKSRADSRSDKNEKLAKVQESINAATTAAENFLAREDSDRIVLTTKDEKGNPVAMNLHQATEFISTLRKNAPVRKDGEDYDVFQKRIANHMNEVNTLEEQLRNSKQSEIEQIMSSANNGSLTGEGGIEASYEINNHLNDARKAVKDSKVSGVNIGVNDLGSASSVHDNIYKENTGALDVVAEEITLQNKIKDKNGNLTHYGRQKADSDSINNRPGNKSSGSSSGKDSGSSK